MKTDAMKKFGAVAGSVALVGTAAVGAVQPALAANVEADAAASEIASPSLADATKHMADVLCVNEVCGQFTFDQNALTSTSDIKGVFAQAAAVLCNGLPAYLDTVAAPIQVSGENAAFSATVEDMAADENAKSMIMGCACSSNVAGGGAIANAEVSGVAIESVYAMTK